MISQPQEMQYAPCPASAHLNQPLTLVCVDPECPDNTLICFGCFQAQHRGHRTLPLAEFLREVECGRYDQSVQDRLSSTLAHLKALKAKSLDRIEQVRRGLERQLGDLQQRMLAYYETIESTFRAEVQRCLGGAPSSFQYDPRRGADSLIRSVRELLASYSENRQHQAFIDERMQRALDRITEAEAERATAYGRLLRNCSGAAEWLGRSFSTIDLQHSDWSLRGHHPDIAVRGSTVTRERSTANDYEHQSAGALLKCPLEASRAHSWTFRVRRLVSWVAVGICLESKTQEFDLTMYNWGSDCHGHYAISSAGCVYAHANQDANCEERGFRFRTGDVVRVTYEAGELRFDKVDRDGADILATVKMAVLPPPKGAAYRACVYLWRVGEAVELLDWT